jgi:hypothetical protein
MLLKFGTPKSINCGSRCIVTSKSKTPRAFDDYISNAGVVPELKDLIKMSATPLELMPPPYDDKSVMRENEQIRSAKQAILKLNFEEMLQLGILIFGC